MDIHQISTGNLFLHKGKVIEIENIDAYAFPTVYAKGAIGNAITKEILVGDLEPIPATLSELQKLGFELVEYTFYHHPKLPFLHFDPEINEFWLSDTDLGKMYIHEIQNMISIFERFNFGV